jgi:hypothetical protein
MDPFGTQNSGMAFHDDSGTLYTIFGKKGIVCRQIKDIFVPHKQEKSIVQVCTTCYKYDERNVTKMNKMRKDVSL